MGYAMLGIMGYNGLEWVIVGYAMLGYNGLKWEQWARMGYNGL
jgi:hypothetical protein